MPRPVKERHIKTLIFGSYKHILIEQDQSRETYNMRGAYMGNSGYVLKAIVKLKN